MLDPALEAAYRATTYRVDVDGSAPIAIRIGEVHPELDRLLEARDFASWAFVTACNPGSVALEGSVNAERTAALDRALEESGVEAIAGEGVGDDGTWPPEPSRLLLGVDRDQATAWGRRFGQAAVVYGGKGLPAELLVL